MSESYSKKFDYLVVGGGLAGLVVAARLSEDPLMSVCVLEAGGETLIPNVQIPGFLRESLGKPALDWMFFSTPQTSATGQLIYMPRGKGIGGSSMLNFMVLGRSSSGDYNAFEKIGNKGWNWPEFLKYLKKSENFTAPSPEIAKENQLETSVNPKFHGTSGPLMKSLPRWISDLHIPFIDALKSLGVPYNLDSGNGDNTGVTTVPIAIHPENATRSYSGSAYYEPNKGRKNLHVLTGAHVTRVVFSPESGGDVIAVGVEFVKDGKRQTLRAQKEIVLSAGAFQTPQILELSGIGDPEILAQHDVEVTIALPGVGANLREILSLHSSDHSWTPAIFQTTSQYKSLEAFSKPEVLAQQLKLYETEKRGAFSSVHSAEAFLPLEAFTDPETLKGLKKDLAAQAAAAKGGLAVELNVQKELLSDSAVAQLELAQVSAFFVPPGMDAKPEDGISYLTLMPAIQHPLSRGSVHIRSSNPLDPPAIDPAFYTNSFDLDLMINGLKFARKVAATEPICSAVIKEVYPGPDIKTDNDLKTFARKFVGTLFHPVGTAAMKPKEHQGVVAPNLVVYGTKNLRIVDASVIPIHIGGHPQSTIYAIAEKAADLIKACQ